MRSLRLTGPFDDECLKLLADGVKFAPGIKQLDLCKSGLDDYSLVTLLDAGLLRSNVEELRLGQNQLCGYTIDNLVDEIKHPHCKLRVLDVRDCLFCSVMNHSKTFDVASLEARRKLRAVAAERNMELRMFLPLECSSIQGFVIAALVSGGITLALWMAFSIVFSVLFVAVRAASFVLERSRLLIRPFLRTSQMSHCGYHRGRRSSIHSSYTVCLFIS